VHFELYKAGDSWRMVPKADCAIRWNRSQQHGSGSIFCVYCAVRLYDIQSALIGEMWTQEKCHKCGLLLALPALHPGTWTRYYV
jgi:hypothetical protein